MEIIPVDLSAVTSGKKKSSSQSKASERQIQGYSDMIEWLRHACAVFAARCEFKFAPYNLAIGKNTN